MKSDDRAGAVSAKAVSGEALRVEGIAKRFGGLRVFDPISFQLAEDEILGVIGPNGAGKTTLINVICGMIVPSAGRVCLGDRNITGLPFHSVSQLGVVRSFQQTNTFSKVSVEENLFRAKRFGSDRSGTDLGLDDLLHDFELAGHLDEPSDKLPYGLQKMLGLIMVLATRPSFILMDEPAAGLERRERSRVDRFIAHARKVLRCGIMIVEHDMDLVKRLCPTILVLEAGRLLAKGPPAEVLARPDVINAYLGDSGD
jgi:branched-chain amino acid transport system ATP-binding protein